MLRVPLQDTDQDDEDRVTYRGERFTGVTVETYRDGSLLTETHYTDGVEDGPERQFRPDGSLEEETIYDFGLPAIERKWHPNGQLAYEAHLRQGSLVSEQWWDEDGNPIPAP